MNEYKLFFFVVHVIVYENDFVGVIFFFFKPLICYVWLSVSFIRFNISSWLLPCFFLFPSLIFLLYEDFAKWFCHKHANL